MTNGVAPYCMASGSSSIRTEFSVVGAWEGLRHRWMIERGTEKADRSFVLRLYAASEMRELILAAGFSSVGLYGGLDGSPYDQDARSLVAVARC